MLNLKFIVQIYYKKSLYVKNVYEKDQNAKNAVHSAAMRNYCRMQVMSAAGSSLSIHGLPIYLLLDHQCDRVPTAALRSASNVVGRLISPPKNSGRIRLVQRSIKTLNENYSIDM